VLLEQFEIEADDSKRYALKELKNFDMINKERFEREIKILSELNHPNIVKIFQWNIGYYSLNPVNNFSCTTWNVFGDIGPACCMCVSSYRNG
jgi:serine/threonine protein kinase